MRKSKYLRILCALAAVVLLTTAFSMSAFAAKSLEEQMAENSAAWWVAHNAGDQATCDALHEANEEIAVYLANGGGNATYNANTGTWSIGTASGSQISSSSAANGKQQNVTYTTTTNTGATTAAQAAAYSDAAIAAYLAQGGTNQGLQVSYNNAAAVVTATNSYGDTLATTTADAEVSVAKQLLGLTTTQAKQLKAELEQSKKAYNNASAAYDAAVAAGDTAAAAAAKEQMNAAHDAAQATRAKYNYTGDDTNTNATDGGYYSGVTKPNTSGGGFYLTVTCKITAKSSEGGKIDPDGDTHVKMYTDKKFTLLPDEGYELKTLKVDDKEQDITKLEAGEEENSLTYTFKNVTTTHTIEAEFAKKSYTITASAGTNGTISPAGESKVEHGTDKTYTITPNTGYQVSDVKVDGVSVGKVSTYTFEKIKDKHTISVTFEKKTYTISASAGTGGSISPNGETSVSYGGSKTFTVKPNTGYKVYAIKVDGKSMGSITSYTFKNVTAAHTISVSFAKQSFTIKASAGTGGSISPSGSYAVTYGSSKKYSITPSTGYRISNVVVDGVSKGAISSYTFSNVTAAHTISATFTKLSYSITASAGTGGTISPAGTTAVTYGSSQTFTITPNTGYKVKSVTVDGVNQGAITSYTFSTVNKSHTIAATFEKLTYQITASCGTGGSISPSGTTTVEYGSSKTYAFTPNSGYEVADVLVDGKSVGAVTSYTFSNVTGAHTISVSFRANGKISILDFTVTDSLGADLSGKSIKSGYGIFAKVSGSYSGVTNVKMVMSYNFGSGNQTVTLQETSTGTFAFPKNSVSPTNQRCVYIPVATKDGSYTLTLTFTATKADGTTLTETKTTTVTVLGSIYEDDFSATRS